MVFTSSSAPLELMLLLDTSASMTAQFGFVQKAAVSLLRSLQPRDQAAVVLFADSVRVVQPLTNDLLKLEEAVQNARPRGSTSLYEAVYIAQHELARARRAGGDLRRQAIVVLSDGDDTRSRISFADVLDMSRRNPITTFTIVPTPPEDLKFLDRSGQRVRFDMRQIAEETGGRAFSPGTPADLAKVYDDIARELGEQYWLAYVRPPGAPTGFRRVSVRVESRAGLVARTRAGFYAGRTSGSTSPSRGAAQ
jgi:Ca-activated chloride channel family protein